MKQVIIVRKDLKMRKGKMVAQGAHASLAIFTNYCLGYPFSWLKLPLNIIRFIFLLMTDKHVRTWFTGQFTKICVYVDSEEELIDCYHQAKSKGLLCSIIRDAGKTEFKGVPTYTTVAIGPGPVESINNITGSLKLM